MMTVFMARHFSFCLNKDYGTLDMTDVFLTHPHQLNYSCGLNAISEAGIGNEVRIFINAFGGTGIPSGK